MDLEAHGIQQIEKRLDKIEDEIQDLKDGFFKELNEKFIGVSTDVSWLKRFFWIVATTSVGSMLTTILSAIYK